MITYGHNSQRLHIMCGDLRCSALDKGGSPLGYIDNCFYIPCSQHTAGVMCIMSAYFCCVLNGIVLLCKYMNEVLLCDTLYKVRKENNK